MQQEDWGTHSPAAASPGALLRAAREQARMAREDLAARLHLPLRTLEALEEDRFEQLPEPPYVRGYLRGCAKILEVDAEPMISALEQATGALRERLEIAPSLASGDDRSTARTTATAAPAASGGAGPWVIIIGVVLLAALILGLFLFSGDLFRDPAQPEAGGEETAPVSAEPSIPSLPARIVPTLEAPESESPAVESAAPAPATPEPPLAPPAATQATPAAPSPEAIAAPVATEPPPPAGQGRLVLRFEEDSWVEITDAGGNRLLVGLMRKGSERRIEGAVPIRVFLGNAPGVRLTFNGQSMDMSGDTRADNTARFTVGRR